jgi:hypothetical protein
MPGLKPRSEIERLLRPLLICADCNGAGERWHAEWPELPPPKLGDPAMMDVPAVEKRWGACDTCGGDGRLHTNEQ